MRKKAAQREASLEGLLGAALRLFVSHGYGTTTLEKIAAAAGLTKGAVYFYFGSKEAVLVELLTRVKVIVFDEMAEAVDAAGPSPRDKLVAFLNHQARLGVTRRDEVLLLILMSLEFGGRSGAACALIGDIYGKLHRFVEQLIETGQQTGDFRNDVAVKELAALVMANHDGTFLQWHRHSSELNGRELVRALRAIVLGGLALPYRAGQAADPRGDAQHSS